MQRFSALDSFWNLCYSVNTSKRRSAVFDLPPLGGLMIRCLIFETDARYVTNAKAVM